ncbi:MAG: serine hydrolase [Elusimicrobiota bacterium]|nr:serine hydrolase [Elusimicrobiota bacterium]
MSIYNPLRVRILRFAAIFVFAASSASAQGLAYDIAYLWRPDLAGVAAYKAKVSDIMGPDVARHLRVVRAGGKYGLVYLRNGGRDSAVATAKVHTRFLAAHGLKPAVPVRTQDWGFSQSESRPDPVAPPLESKIDTYVKYLRRRGLIKSDERTAWSVYDLTDDTKLAGINEDMPMQAASLIKPFIALAYFHEAASGRRKYTEAARNRMEDMIRDSDNAAANRFMRLLGGPAAVQRLLSRNYGEILQDLHLVEYIPPNGRTYRNKASVHDYSRFLYSLWSGALPGSAEIKRVMNLPKRTRLCTGVPGVPPGTEVYSKTGTTSRLCADIGILVAHRADGKRYPYIVIGVIQKGRSANSYYDWMQDRGDVIRHVSDLVYEEISSRHRFEDFNSPNPGSSEDGEKIKLPLPLLEARSALTTASLPN